MSAQTKNKKNINLLVQEGFEHSTLGKLLSWLLSAGRTIVVLTELIVVIAFLSRFWLDKQLTDLSEANNSKKVQIEASSQFETDFKSAQARVNIIKQIKTEKADSAGLIKSISQVVPGDVTLSSIAINVNQLMLQGSSLSEVGINGLLNSIESSDKFSNPTLSDVALENSSQQFIKFTIKADLEKKQN